MFPVSIRFECGIKPHSHHDCRNNEWKSIRYTLYALVVHILHMREGGYQPSSPDCKALKLLAIQKIPKWGKADPVQGGEERPVVLIGVRLNQVEMNNLCRFGLGTNGSK